MPPVSATGRCAPVNGRESGMAMRSKRPASTASAGLRIGGIYDSPRSDARHDRRRREGNRTLSEPVSRATAQVVEAERARRVLCWLSHGNAMERRGTRSMHAHAGVCPAPSVFQCDFFALKTVVRSPDGASVRSTVVLGVLQNGLNGRKFITNPLIPNLARRYSCPSHDPSRQRRGPLGVAPETCSTRTRPEHTSSLPS